MKQIQIILFFILFSQIHSQNLSGIIQDSLIFRKSERTIFHLKLTNQNNEKVFTTDTNETGEFKFNDLEVGTYKLSILNNEYQQNEYKINLKNSLNQIFYAEKYCKYRVNKSKYCPICKSEKNAVPIFYGLTTTKFMKKNKNKYHFAGCEISNCNPHLYCKKDKIEF